jgi:hypothetical protein
MNTNIYKSNSTPLASIAAGQYDSTASSLILFGKNFANYGAALNENMVHIMEHFASNTPPANPIQGQFWYDTTTSQVKVWDNGWTLLNANSLQDIADSIVKNRIYVSKSGNDANSGLSWFRAKLTIASACAEIAMQQASGNFDSEHAVILVASGDYTEQCPILVPQGVSIIGDNLRSVTVRPAVPTSNVFLLNSKCYVYGLTVRGHQLSPSAFDITPTGYAGSNGTNLPLNTVQTGWAFSFAPGANIQVSPYIQNCSSISGDPNPPSDPGIGNSEIDSGAYPGGGGVLVDSNSIATESRIHSIVVDAFTQVNLGGIGVKIVGKGYMQLVSFFVNFCQFGILTCDGGHATLLNSNCSFGNYALWADGSRTLDNPSALNETWTGNGITDRFIATNSSSQVFSGQVPDVVVYINGILKTLYVDYTIDSIDASPVIIKFIVPPPNNSTIVAAIKFGSLIEASGYTMSYAGAGLNYTNLSPSQNGIGQRDPNKYTIATNGGKIYHTTTDEAGDFYVGLVTPGSVVNNVQQSARPSFRINQRKGVIDGRSFYQSIFGFMTPFILALTRK